jgi:hypothetical protein
MHELRNLGKLLFITSFQIDCTAELIEAATLSAFASHRCSASFCESKCQDEGRKPHPMKYQQDVKTRLLPDQRWFKLRQPNPLTLSCFSFYTFIRRALSFSLAGVDLSSKPGFKFWLGVYSYWEKVADNALGVAVNYKEQGGIR